jgi:AAA15 family ATPase/GTPase
MKLLQFRVQKFRSVEDSGWISCDEITTLVGMNEAGKSNLLMALWKLKPAKGGEISPLSDVPRRLYSTYRSQLDQLTFIEADFELDSETDQKIKKVAFLQESEPLIVRVSKNFTNEMTISFLNALLPTNLTFSTLHKTL